MHDSPFRANAPACRRFRPRSRLYPAAFGVGAPGFGWHCCPYMWLHQGQTPTHRPLTPTSLDSSKLYNDRRARPPRTSFSLFSSRPTVQPSIRMLSITHLKTPRTVTTDDVTAQPKLPAALIHDRTYSRRDGYILINIAQVQRLARQPMKDLRSCLCNREDVCTYSTTFHEWKTSVKFDKPRASIWA